MAKISLDELLSQTKKVPLDDFLSDTSSSVPSIPAIPKTIGQKILGDLQGLGNLAGGAIKGVGQDLSGYTGLSPQNALAMFAPTSSALQPALQNKQIYDPNSTMAKVGNVGGMAIGMAPAVAASEGLIGNSIKNALLKRAAIGGLSSAIATPGGVGQRLESATIGAPVGAFVPPLASAIKGIPAALMRGPGTIKNALKSINFDENNLNFLSKLAGNTTDLDRPDNIREGVIGASNEIKNISNNKYNNVSDLIKNSTLNDGIDQTLKIGQGNKILTERNRPYNFMNLSYKSTSIGKNFPSDYTIHNGKLYQAVPVKNLETEDFENKGGIIPNQSLEKLKNIHSSIKDPLLKEQLNTYLTTPTYDNAHALQNTMFNEGRDLIKNPNAIKEDKILGGKILDARDALNKDIMNSVSKHSPEAANALADASQFFKENVAPYRSTIFNKIINPERYGDTTQNIHEKLLSGNPNANAITRHLAQISPETNDLILYQKLNKGNPVIRDEDNNIVYNPSAKGNITSSRNKLLQNYNNYLQTLNNTTNPNRLLNNYSNVIGAPNKIIMNNLLNSSRSLANLKQSANKIGKTALKYGAGGIIGSALLDKIREEL